MSITIDQPLPSQYKQPQNLDFRSAAHGPKGYKERSKRKLEEYEQQLCDQAEQEAAEALDQGPSTTVSPPWKRQKHNTVGVGKASGRPWKRPGERAGSLKNPLLSTTWETKMKLKAEQNAFKLAKREAIGAHKAKLEKVRKQREEARQRKEENRKKSAVTEAINNTTLRKMMKSKKQRKMLQKADTLK